LLKEKISEVISLLSHEDYSIRHTAVEVLGKLLDYGEGTRDSYSKFILT
jgi:hypothetical protein